MFHFTILTYYLFESALTLFRSRDQCFALIYRLHQRCQSFSNLRQILYRAKIGGPQKVVHAESCSDF